jgi:putative ABC transport system permease protein
MNVFKIAFRSVQYRGLGSLLTIISMALGVMMVVAVLTIHGVVSESFKNNTSFGYNILVGAQGGSLQLTMNSVFYLSQPIDTLPYEYYLSFCDENVRSKEMRNSIAYKSLEEHQRVSALATAQANQPGLGFFESLAAEITEDAMVKQRLDFMEIDRAGFYQRYTDTAIPILLGDYFQKEDSAWRVCATNRNFFDKLILDVDKQNHFEFAEGRCFDNFDQEVGYFGAVVGSITARQAKLKVGDRILVTHGDPSSESSHLHDQEFTVTGILASTGTPNDRVLFVNMEGFYLINDHIKPVRDDSLLSKPAVVEVDPFAAEAEDETTEAAERQADANQTAGAAPASNSASEDKSNPPLPNQLDVALLNRTPLPIEHREITSILLRTSKNDPYNLLGEMLPPRIKEGELANSLSWSPFRPVRAQTGAQAVNPVGEITKFFAFFVDPARWLLLGLTILICVVSGLSILVGIYNSMSQRHHEIAVMRALGANRSKVMLILLLESVLLALSGGLLGWFAGHALNAVLGPLVEGQTGVPLGFWNFAPKLPLSEIPYANSFLSGEILQFAVSPELLLIPGLILLAIAVGIYPAISAYRADIAKSLGK